MPPSLVEKLPFSARELDQVLFIPLPLDLCERRVRSIFAFDEFCNLRIRTSIEGVHRNIPIKEPDVLEVFLVLAHDECAGESGGHGGVVGGGPSTEGSYSSENQLRRGAARQTGHEAGERNRRREHVHDYDSEM